ncbi:9329_t:CDS:1, partial [Rhizophagus irregularis]
MATNNNNEATLVQNDINNKMQDIEYATSDCEQSSSKSLSTFMLNM